MANFVIMEPEAATGEAAVATARIVRDGFSVLAFLVPPVWLAWRGLWLEAAVAVAASLGLVALGEAAGFGFAGSALSLLLSLYVGLEGSTLWLAALSRRGWREWGAVDAETAADAELRYASAVADDTERPTAEIVEDPAEPPAAWQGASRISGPAIGLLAYPGQR